MVMENLSWFSAFHEHGIITKLQHIYSYTYVHYNITVCKSTGFKLNHFSASICMCVHIASYVYLQLSHKNIQED